MVQIPILSGVYADTGADFQRSLPVNLTPVAEPGDTSGTGISKGYLRAAAGVRTVFPLPGGDRGGYAWNGSHLRVVGQILYRLTDVAVALGQVGGDGPVTFAEGFGRVAIAAGGSLYYWDGMALTPVTDVDLGPVFSVAWSDGYFLTTDGTSLVATDLANPTSVDPLRYGSSEADPDAVKGMLAIRGEVYALNRFSIEKFVNTGGAGFPFARSRGSQIPKGCVGPAAFAPFQETFAFCGSARNEPVGVYLAGSGQGIKISPRVLDKALAALTDAELAAVEVETFAPDGQPQLLVHLPAGTWAYHWTASQQLDQPVWSRLHGGVDDAYPARHFTLSEGEWWAGGAAGVGRVDYAEPALFGQPHGFSFDTPIIYNEGSRAQVHELELVTLAGRTAIPTEVDCAASDDGLTWSMSRTRSAGALGDRLQRPVWRRMGLVRHWRLFRFSGQIAGPIAFARLDADLEGLGG